MKKLFKIFSILILLITTTLVPAKYTNAVNNNLTNQVRIFNLSYSGLPSNQSGNLETMLLDFDFSGEYDASSLGDTIQSGDYFTVPFNSQDSNITLGNAEYPLLNEEGTRLGTLTTNRQSGLLTFTFNDDIVGLDNVKGTFKVKATAKVVRGENNFTFPDGTTKTVNYTEVQEWENKVNINGEGIYKSVEKNINANGAPQELINKLISGEISTEEYLKELEKYSTSSLVWKVRVNRSGGDYGTSNVTIKDSLKLDSGVVLTYLKDSFVLNEVTYSDTTPTTVRNVTITTDEQEFLSSNGSKAHLTFTNGGTAFVLNLGNNVGTKSYELTYKTAVPDGGYSVSNGVTLYRDQGAVLTHTSKTENGKTENNTSTESVAKHTEQAVGGTVTGDLVSRIRVTKYDSEDASILLANAVFKIAKENSPNQVVATLTTNDKGVAISDKLEPGRYIVKETTAPSGYRIDSSSKLVTVNANSLTYLPVSNQKGENEPETTQVTGQKVWEDNNNQDGKRPEKITVNLLADGEQVGSKEVSSTNNWSYEFTNLPKFKDGQEIKYTVTENQVVGYTAEINGYNITNKYTPETTQVSGVKTWEDNNNQDGKRPTSITVNLLANGEIVQSKEISEQDNWSYEFTNLPKFKDGQEVNYTVTENQVEGYTPEINGYNITNKYTPETTQVTGQKTWEDNNNQDGKRPTSITVNLLSNGEIVQIKEVSEQDNWSYEFTNLPKFKDGKEVNYTVTENQVTGYETIINGYNITNKYTSETTQVSGQKVWEDNNNQDGKRPERITVNLLADGEIVQIKEVSEQDNWNYEFTNLPKFKDGQEVNYTVTENQVYGYTTEINGYNITNKYTPEVTNVSGVKTWEDNNNQDGKRPEKITVNLLVDGEQVDSKEVSASDNWSYEFTNLPKFKDGKEVSYTVTENQVDGYTPEINGYNITNKYTPETTQVTGVKTWEDNNNQDGKRPTSITVNLLSNGELVQSKEVSEQDNWSYEFTNLPKFKDGKEVNYTVTENQVAGYTPEINGYNITNKYTPEVTQVSGQKTWEDKNNQDGKRPEKITVNLLADGEQVDSKEVSATDNWSYEFTNLPKFKDGKEVNYTVTENQVYGYTTEINGYNITNKYTPEDTQVTGVKAWEDNNNQDGKRPTSITVNLLSN
ncbi:Cna B-type domain-containing protein, partial [Gemella sp. GH3]|uniref:Cna B-type domain-containing protein n=1 Tax=unclassified Gemella TaxID=2624949 RepID=UPI0015D0BBD0